jgi:hypothetical protein
MTSWLDHADLVKKKKKKEISLPLRSPLARLVRNLGGVRGRALLRGGGERQREMRQRDATAVPVAVMRWGM